LTIGDSVQILTFEDREGKEIFWHSSLTFWPRRLSNCIRRKPTIGPAIEEGFYYDFADLTISDTDFERIEEEVQSIVKQNIQPQRIDYSSRAEALAVFGNNPFKKEMIEQLEEA